LVQFVLPTRGHLEQDSLGEQAGGERPAVAAAGVQQDAAAGDDGLPQDGVAGNDGLLRVLGNGPGQVGVMEPLRQEGRGVSCLQLLKLLLEGLTGVQAGVDEKVIGVLDGPRQVHQKLLVGGRHLLGKLGGVPGPVARQRPGVAGRDASGVVRLVRTFHEAQSLRQVQVMVAAEEGRLRMQPGPGQEQLDGAGRVRACVHVVAEEHDP
jgi:hypothetical protein